jgi:ElaB/YqjD/DUF883 family membrane-anchored ribosome-binding protein
MNNNQTQNTNSKDFANGMKSQVDKTLDQGEKALHRATDKAESVYDSAREQLSHAGEKISKGYDVATEELKKVSSQFEGAIKSNPILAIGVAAGLGWAIGRYLSTKPSPMERS